MIYRIVEAFKEGSLRHKAVWTFKYQDRILINAQPNNKYYQVILETDGYFDQKNDQALSLTINLDILGFVEVDEQTTQDICSQIGLSILNRVVNENRDIMSLEGYSILLFTKSTDDSAAGARFTIRLAVPQFIDYCIDEDYFLEDEEYEEKLLSLQDSDLDLGDREVSDQLDLHPL